ncbi:uncharacterized protein TM35_000062420 [Trypanosoma theileri]|uniref:Uncharacterized protein n=1 Tax=Trypanosoma theileri TaxID=67003 RepID=A0A1X0P2S8_9TRYP|nr:uncharacterized protein TM35_000062420 [Trypanosoma theileri]ORC91237.1 hypothetical protein TM35_000062420 [Trypanosoma theileri]
MGSCCCRESSVENSSLSGISEKDGDSNKCPLIYGPSHVEGEEEEDDQQKQKQQNEKQGDEQHQKQQSLSSSSGDPHHSTLEQQKPTIAKIATPPLPSALSPIHSMRIKVYTSNVAPPFSASFDRDLSDTIVCSSTTIENSSADPAMFHRRVETAASSTWPEVSMPTVSVRYDHHRTVSGTTDSEVDYSPVERSTSTLYERRLSFNQRERERALMREVSSVESEKRYAIVEFFNKAWRTIALRHYRGIWALTRRQMVVSYLGERYGLLMCSLEMQESIHRRLIECEWQTLLLSKMQKLRFDRQRHNYYELAATTPSVDTYTSTNTSIGMPAAAASPAASPIDEELPGAASVPLGRCVSAPSVYWRKSHHQHSRNHEQQHHQQRHLTLLHPLPLSPAVSPSHSPSPPRRRLYKSYGGSSKRLLPTSVQEIIYKESSERLGLEREEKHERQEYQLGYEEVMSYYSVV